MKKSEKKKKISNPLAPPILIYNEWSFAMVPNYEQVNMILYLNMVIIKVTSTLISPTK